ncbi:ABC transporter permease subunit [Phreatobacter stygius]|uniref:ABC transporter permease subunit n=1 Tax=Phreatobacter stygius TaxID=1940610 RepID=A0A4D7BHM7_9HYPH|nr:ABC transporter permease subunit [Phreatobacter stygius]
MIYDKRAREIFWQVVILLALVIVTVFIVRNASQNMVNAGIASGFDFLWRTSGIDVPFVLTDYTSNSNILGLLWVGVVNTLVVTIVSIIAATLLGFVVGVARLSKNKLLSGIAGAFIEIVRNIPLLFFVMFWYSLVINALPAPRQSIGIFSVAFLNNRGLTIPVPVEGSAFKIAALVILAGIVGQAAIAIWAKRRRDATGQIFPAWATGLVLLIGLPVLAFGIAGFATTWDLPAFRGFNFRGGFVLVPEFVALFLALTVYTAGFIAEVVRGGIQAVVKGQWEAAYALGLRPNRTLSLVVIPQAMRVMIPPMTSQYLNVLKNSSFGAAIAYPDLVSVFVGSALNNTGQAIEIIAITLAIYLAIGLAVSGFMNWYNAKTALVTR